MSFIPTKVRPAQADKSFTELEGNASLCALADAPQTATLDALSETTSSENIQFRTRRERREAERREQALARVEAFAASLRSAKAVSIEPLLAEDGASFDAEIPASFRAQWKSGRTRMSRIASGRRVSGSTLALGLMAGTVVLGTGSAAAFAAVNTTEAGDIAATVTEETNTTFAPEQATAPDATVAEAEAAASTAPEIEVTSVAAFDSATVAGLAVADEAAEVAAEQTASASSGATSAAQAGVVWPVGSGSSVSSYFGPRSSPTWGASSWHEGVDFTPGYGAPVGSMAAGTVVNVDYGSTSYGLYIDVEHTINGQTITTRYAHLSAINVSIGQSVSAGETIGNVGNTGVSTGAHLHFEVHINGEPTDPLAYLQSNA